ncbi:MAG: transporter substrate-binding domain-containing protein [Alphaproteobacteria bacterium]|nr:transporter substrate-binding domain-containing protein [Alphaproteobacteria bacterium]
MLGARLHRIVLSCLGLFAAMALGPFPAWSTPPARFEGRPTVILAYEVRANPPRHLGTGTAIDWERPGLTLELLRTVGERLRINFQFKRMPWKRGLYLVETGEVDGLFHASYKADREAIGVYPKTAEGRLDEGRAIFFQSYALHVLKGSPVRWDGKTISGLGDRPVGVTGGYSIIGDLLNMSVRIEEGKVQELNLSKLIEGRIAAYAELENMAAAAIRREPSRFADVVKLEPPLATKAYYLLLSHPFVARDPALAEAIWGTIAQVNVSAEFQARIDVYATGS